MAAFGVLKCPYSESINALNTLPCQMLWINRTNDMRRYVYRVANRTVFYARLRTNCLVDYSLRFFWIAITTTQCIHSIIHNNISEWMERRQRGDVNVADAMYSLCSSADYCSGCCATLSIDWCHIDCICCILQLKPLKTTMGAVATLADWFSTTFIIDYNKIVWNIHSNIHTPAENICNTNMD